MSEELQQCRQQLPDVNRVVHMLQELSPEGFNPLKHPQKLGSFDELGLAEIVLTWLGEPEMVKLAQGESFYGFLLERLAEIQALLEGASEPRRLWSLLNSEAGFVELQTLWAEGSEVLERPWDVAQTLLRLDPAQSPPVPPENWGQEIMSSTENFVPSHVIILLTSPLSRSQSSHSTSPYLTVERFVLAWVTGRSMLLWVNSCGPSSSSSLHK